MWEVRGPAHPSPHPLVRRAPRHPPPLSHESEVLSDSRVRRNPSQVHATGPGPGVVDERACFCAMRGPVGDTRDEARHGPYALVGVHLQLVCPRVRLSSWRNSELAVGAL